MRCVARAAVVAVVTLAVGGLPSFEPSMRYDEVFSEFQGDVEGGLAFKPAATPDQHKPSKEAFKPWPLQETKVTGEKVKPRWWEETKQDEGTSDLTRYPADSKHGIPAEGTREEPSRYQWWEGRGEGAEATKLHEQKIGLPLSSELQHKRRPEKSNALLMKKEKEKVVTSDEKFPSFSAEGRVEVDDRLDGLKAEEVMLKRDGEEEKRSMDERVSKNDKREKVEWREAPSREGSFREKEQQQWQEERQNEEEREEQESKSEEEEVDDKGKKDDDEEEEKQYDYDDYDYDYDYDYDDNNDDDDDSEQEENSTWKHEKRERERKLEEVDEEKEEEEKEEKKEEEKEEKEEEEEEEKKEEEEKEEKEEEEARRKQEELERGRWKEVEEEAEGARQDDEGKIEDEEEKNHNDEEEEQLQQEQEEHKDESKAKEEDKKHAPVKEQRLDEDEEDEEDEEATREMKTGKHRYKHGHHRRNRVKGSM